MTTFTTEDRIIAEKDGSFTVNVNAGSVTSSPPHIVDSGASVINNEPVAIVRLGGDVEWLTDVLPYNAKLYTHPAKTLTDEEIRTLIDEHWEKTSNVNLFDFARAILRKAQEK